MSLRQILWRYISQKFVNNLLYTNFSITKLTKTYVKYSLLLSLIFLLNNFVLIGKTIPDIQIYDIYKVYGSSNFSLEATSSNTGTEITYSIEFFSDAA